MWWSKRIFRLAACLFIVLSLNFFLPRSMPGDPLLMLLGPDAVALSQTDYEQLKTEYGLDRPLGEQYADYWSKLWRGQLGYSFHHNRPVAALIRENLGRSLAILAPAVLISTLLSAILGTAAGWKHGSPLDISLTLSAVVFFGAPSFMIAMVFLDVFGFRLGWFPLGGFSSSLGTHSSFLEATANFIRHAALPVLAIVLSSAAAKFMVMRNAVVSESRSDYVLYAKAKGVSPWKIAFAHVFKNACLPLLNVAALHAGFMVSGAVLVEIVFSINGMGVLIFDAALNRDYPVLQGCFLVLTLVVIGLNFLVDMASGLLDPRIRHGR